MPLCDSRRCTWPIAGYLRLRALLIPDERQQLCPASSNVTATTYLSLRASLHDNCMKTLSIQLLGGRLSAAGKSICGVRTDTPHLVGDRVNEGTTVLEGITEYHATHGYQIP